MFPRSFPLPQCGAHLGDILVCVDGIVGYGPEQCAGHNAGRLLAGRGMWAGLGVWYFVGSVGGVAGAMGYFIRDVDLKSQEHCGMWYYRQTWLVG